MVSKNTHEDVFKNKKKKGLIFDAQVHFAEQRGVWERKLPGKLCDVSTFSFCLYVCPERAETTVGVSTLIWGW